MAEIRYTKQEYDRAVEYITQRIGSELSMTSDIESLLYEYAGYILHALYEGASEEDINLLIEDLIERIMSDCRVLAADEHDGADKLIPAVFYGGDETVEDRVRKRVDTFLDELLTSYSAAEILHMDEKSLMNIVGNSMDDPWDNEAISEVRGMIERGEVDGNIGDFDERHYGQGIPISSRTGLEVICVSAIVEVWNEWAWRSASALGAVGYYVERGSSFPCDTCQDHVGTFFPIDDKEHLPQYHRNCRCFVIYCYGNGDTGRSLS